MNAVAKNKHSETEDRRLVCETALMTGLRAKRAPRTHADAAKGNEMTAPLLDVPDKPSQCMERDMARAGVSKRLPGGKLDFHALRTAFINLVFESGPSVKEAQTLARHSDPNMTMNVYGRTRDERLAGIVEAVDEAVNGKTCQTYAKRQAAGAETCYVEGDKVVPGGGLEPPLGINPTRPST